MPGKVRLKNAAAREFHRLATANGFELVRSNNHLVYQKPGLPPLVVSATPSDGRALKNNVARMKRMLRQTA